MRLNETEQAKILLNVINTIVDNKIKNLPYVKFVKGKVTLVNNNEANVVINNNEYENIRIMQGLSLQENDTVWLLVKNNDITKAFIIDVIS